MFYQPDLYVVPSRRRNSKRLLLNNTKIQYKLRENKINFQRTNNLNVKDINKINFHKAFSGKVKNHLNMHKEIKGAQPKILIPKKYNENNSFDYSDINISRRVIRKMVQSSLFDHKPYEKAKYIDKIIIGNKFISKVDPVEMTDPAKSMNSFSLTRPLGRSMDMTGGSKFRRSTRRQISLFGKSLNQSLNSLSAEKTQSLKDFRSCIPYAGSPTK